jgi:hypothetical protein
LVADQETKTMIEERPIKEIINDVNLARADGVTLKWTSQELATDMLTIAKQMILEIEKYLNKDMEAPAKRIRLDSKILETLGKSFRVQSIKEKSK